MLLQQIMLEIMDRRPAVFTSWFAAWLCRVCIHAWMHARSSLQSIEQLVVRRSASSADGRIKGKKRKKQRTMSCILNN